MNSSCTHSSIVTTVPLSVGKERRCLSVRWWKSQIEWTGTRDPAAGLSFPLKRPYIDMSGLTLPLVHLLENLREPTGTELERETSLV